MARRRGQRCQAEGTGEHLCAHTGTCQQRQEMFKGRAGSSVAGEGTEASHPHEEPAARFASRRAQGGCQALLGAFLWAFHNTRILSPPEMCTAPPLAGKAKHRKGRGCRRAGNPAWCFTWDSDGATQPLCCAEPGRHTWAQQNNPHRLCCSSQPKITTDEGRRLSGMH